MSFPRAVTLLAFLSLVLASACRTDQAEDDPARLQVSFFLQRELESASPPAYINTETRGAVRIWKLMRRSYQERGFDPIWYDSGGIRQLDELKEAICQSAQEGLNPASYHLNVIDRVHERANDDESDDVTRAEELAKLELLASHAFLLYGSHLLSGVINPRWDLVRAELDLFSRMEGGLEAGGVADVLHEELAPSHQGYQQLRETLRRYQEIDAAGGWPQVEATRDWEDQRQAVIGRLISEGDMQGRDRGSADTEGLSEQYSEEEITTAIRMFQRRHRLVDDGVFGPATAAAMNVPVREKIRQIERNMERWRWLPPRISGKHVLVNVAAFELSAMEGTNTVMTMPIVVGEEYRETPLFSDEISYLEVNPYWNIPRSIAVQDMLPRIQQDEAYLERSRMEVLESGTVVDPADVEWEELSEEEFPYRLRQEPGPHNALGRVKFMFPNEYAVYLHDTPDDHLFERRERLYSSGCIRVAKPLELAEWLLEGDPEWTSSRLDDTVRSEETKQIVLPHPVPVYLAYWTVWVGDDDLVYFGGDVYGEDEELAGSLPRQALASATPAGTINRCQ
jgi:L,D-transpeptidase YcbB